MPRRPAPPDSVYFPVVPMLDMAFQLLAFFILTFQPPGRETRLDLELPAAAAALPAGAEVPGPEEVLTVRAEAAADGRLRALRLGPIPVADAADLIDLLRRRMEAPLMGRERSVALVADDRLLYEEAARRLGACAAAGVETVRLVPPPAPASSGGEATP